MMNFNGENERASFLDFIERKNRPANNVPASVVRGESPIPLQSNPSTQDLLRVLGGISGNQPIISQVLQRVLSADSSYLPSSASNYNESSSSLYTTNRTDFQTIKYHNDCLRQSESPGIYTRPNSTQSNFEQYETPASRQKQLCDMEISPEDDNDIEMLRRSPPVPSPHADLNINRRYEKNDFRRSYDNHYSNSSRSRNLADDNIRSFKPENCKNEKREGDSRVDSNFKRNRQNYDARKPVWKSQTIGQTEEKKESSCSELSLPWDFISAGDFRNAFQLLSRQLGIVNFEVYKRFVYRSMLKSNVTFGTIPELPYFNKRLHIKPGSEADRKVEMDFCGVDYLLDRSFRLASAAKFDQAIEKFREVLSWIPLTIVHNSKDELKVKQAVKTCQAYIHGLRMDMKRRSLLTKSSLEDRIRCCELAAYVADCDFLPIHKQITLRVAMVTCFNLNNFKRAAFFAQKLLKVLELTPKHDLVVITQIVYDLCKENLIDEQEINYKDEPYTVCAQTHQPIYEGENQVECPYCGSCYKKPLENPVCVVCELSEIGKKVTGLCIRRR